MNNFSGWFGWFPLSPLSPGLVISFPEPGHQFVRIIRKKEKK
jgi:hypothetical protein